MTGGLVHRGEHPARVISKTRLPIGKGTTLAPKSPRWLFVLTQAPDVPPSRVQTRTFSDPGKGLLLGLFWQWMAEEVGGERELDSQSLFLL